MARIQNKEKTAKIKADIVSLAEILFAKKGYGNVSLNEIIKESKIAKGTFYHYFESKEELLSALIDKKTLFFLEIIKIIVNDKKLNAIDKFNKLNDSIVSRKVKDKKLYRSMMEEMFSEKNSVMMLKMNKKSHDLILPYMTKILTQGKKEGVMKIDNPKETAEILYTNLLTFAESSAYILLKKQPVITKRKQIKEKIMTYREMTMRMLRMEKYRLYIYSDKHLNDILKFA